MELKEKGKLQGDIREYEKTLRANAQKLAEVHIDGITSLQKKEYVNF